MICDVLAGLVLHVDGLAAVLVEVADLFLIYTLPRSLLTLSEGISIVFFGRNLVVSSGSTRAGTSDLFATGRLVTFVGGPVNTITQGLSAATEDWERPEPFVDSENLLPVPLGANVIGAKVVFSFLIKVFNCGFV